MINMNREWPFMIKKTTGTFYLSYFGNLYWSFLVLFGRFWTISITNGYDVFLFPFSYLCIFNSDFKNWIRILSKIWWADYHKRWKKKGMVMYHSGRYLLFIENSFWRLHSKIGPTNSELVTAWQYGMKLIIFLALFKIHMNMEPSFWFVSNWKIWWPFMTNLGLIISGKYFPARSFGPLRLGRPKTPSQ